MLFFLQPFCADFNATTESTDSDAGLNIISSHGEITSLAVHCIDAGDICDLSDQSIELSSTLSQSFGNKSCLVNHLVAPNWTPSAFNGIKGLFEGISALSCLEDCQLEKRFTKSLVAQQELRKLTEEYNLIGASEMVVEDQEDRRKKQLEKEIDRSYNQLIDQLNEDFESNLINLELTNSAGFAGCPTRAGGIGTFRNRFCRENNWGFCDCLGKYKDTLRPYIQDWFLVSENGTSRTIVRTWSPDDYKSSVSMHADYLIKQCDCGISGSVESKVMFEGGDILVSDKFALVGKDIAIRYLAEYSDPTVEIIRANALKELGLSWNLTGLTTYNIDAIHYSLKENLFPNKKLLFLGLNSRKFRNGNENPTDTDFFSYQPTYHIDLAFALIGEMQPDQFTVLVARPSAKYLTEEYRQNEEVLEFINEFNQNLDTLLSILDDFIVDECGYSKLDTVVVPMHAIPVKVGGKYWVFNEHNSLINGISFTDSTSKFAFAFSDFTNPRMNETYGLARSDFEKALNDAGITPYPIRYDYGHNYGLHCISKVLGRN